MTDEGKLKTPRGRRLRWILGPLAPRPRLTISIGLGILAGPAAYYLGHLEAVTAAIVGWDVTCIVFAVVILILMLGKEPHHIAATAVGQDVGRSFILGLVIGAAIASVAAVGVELTFAKAAHGALKAAHVALAFATVAASWFMVQIIFALHYAHEFYAPDNSHKSGIRRGLIFPGGGEPDYWDFLHFSLVIGVAAQTADIGFSSKTQRHVGTLHCVFAFVFNTVVLALTINLLAGLF